MNCPSHFLPVRFPSEQELLFMPQWLRTLCSFHSLSHTHTSSNKIYSRKMIRRKQNDVCWARENNAIAWNERKTKGVSWRKKFSLSAVNAPKFFFLSLLPISCFDTGRRCLWLEKKRKSDHITMIRQEGWIIFWRDPTSIWLQEAVTDDGNDYFCRGKKLNQSAIIAHKKK